MSFFTDTHGVDPSDEETDFPSEAAKNAVDAVEARFADGTAIEFYGLEGWSGDNILDEIED